eukprot:351640-Chlamydomonas_euryale.AAC.1
MHTACAWRGMPAALSAAPSRSAWCTPLCGMAASSASTALRLPLPRPPPPGAAALQRSCAAIAVPVPVAPAPARGCDGGGGGGGDGCATLTSPTAEAGAALPPAGPSLLAGRSSPHAPAPAKTFAPAEQTSSMVHTLSMVTSVALPPPHGAQPALMLVPVWPTTGVASPSGAWALCGLPAAVSMAPCAASPSGAREPGATSGRSTLASSLASCRSAACFRCTSLTVTACCRCCPCCSWWCPCPCWCCWCACGC